MIVLDTNVLSELMRPEPSRTVVRWLDARPPAGLAITAVTAAELLHGVARLPGGRRRTQIAEALSTVLDEDFAGRILAFGAAAAVHYADIVAARERGGRPISTADAQIAAICRSHGADLATRNVVDFDLTGVTVVDPWVA